MKHIPFFSVLMTGLALTVPALAEERSAANRAEAQTLPTFEMMGLPITPVQVQVVGSAHVREQSPTSTLMLAGMPASPHQVAVLTPRTKRAKAAGAAPPSQPILP